jgi:DNA-binding transcriptional regulator LsrR (DeoR family)
MLSFLPESNCTDCEIIQITGGVNGSKLENLSLINLPTRLAKKLNSPVFYIYAPVVVEKATTKEAMLEESVIKDSLDKLNELDVVFVGIGDMEKQSTLCNLGVISCEILEHLRSKGAVGDINARFFDLDGKKITTDIDDRIIGMDTETLKDIKRVIAIAGGKNKHKAILGALNGELINVLITDIDTANYLNNQKIGE